ncbi:MAG: PilZ domain-containing protein [Anaerohalosphaera sp.]|nr:PilZ domain-containing protein [Anaerohalosphaera sp.]
MEGDRDRRTHKRLPLKLGVVCQSVGNSSCRTYTGSTVDVSSGGALIEINGSGLADGQLISVEMSVPPTDGFLDYGGKLSNYARVQRIDRAGFSSNPRLAHSLVQTIALEFCVSPRFAI